MKIFTWLVCLMMPACLYAQNRVIIVGPLNPLGGRAPETYSGEFYLNDSEVGSPDSGLGTWTLTGVGTKVEENHLHCKIQWPVTGGTATLAYTHRNGGIPTMSANPITIIVKIPIQIQATNNGMLPLAGQVDLSASNNYAYQSYEWRKDDGTTVLSRSPIFTVREPGKYNLKVVLTDGTVVTVPPYTVTRIKLGNNYVLMQTLQTPEPGTGIPETLPNTQVQRQIEYYDGLGRPLQSVAMHASPDKTDIVTPRQYDAYDRESITYLPYASTEATGQYKSDAVNSVSGYMGSAQYSFYTQSSTTVARSTNPYAETIFRPAPTREVIKQGAPGEVWQPKPDQSQDKSTENFREVNDDNEVLYFQYDANNGELRWPNNSQLEYYAKNQLHATRTRDEDDNETIVYTDKEGKILLRRTQYEQTSDGTRHYTDTYYVYDDGGNLVYVLPPEAVRSLTRTNE
ncbi:DUF6443 domain-containing protein [Dawidia soli]|uniref:DUF6443 domain-containing protein n=1 Tax=Dawidia soli TaxID=2782352 RepID=A0AAP2GKK3_9BACT|nr:DUF6443 domain-containing protein [Dawidia soli]MBT1689138.1 hypothetical protein [Dawidia soli]